MIYPYHSANGKTIFYTENEMKRKRIFQNAMNISNQ